MAYFNRRKLYNYKVRKQVVPKTARVEMTLVQRAFAVGAIVGISLFRLIWRTFTSMSRVRAPHLSLSAYPPAEIGGTRL